jgi:uncharacterized protein (TIGR02145 family)
MCKKITFLLILSLLIISCSEDNSSGPSNENGSGSQGSEIPCNTSNEGMVIKPADSETERICKDGVWEVVLSSSSSVQVVESSSSEIINIPVPVNSSANENFSSSGEESSSSILSPGETTESSSSESGIIEQSSSSSEEIVESSSSEETKLYLCEDGETYVLDPANCEKVSSSSVIVVSSSSDNKPISSSSVVQESSSSEMSSSSVKQESSSSEVESSSSINISSSSNTESSSSGESSSSLNDGYDANNNTLTDPRDGQIYKTVTIGSQVWMAENLNYLPEDTVGTIWAGKSVCGGGEWRCLVEGDCSTYGRLYESSFTNKSAYRMQICPTGWSLPTKSQYETLISFLGDDAGNKLKIDNPIYWTINDSTNQSGFSAIPAGDWSNKYGFNEYEKNSDIAIASFAMEEYQAKNALKIQDDGYFFIGYGANYYIAVRCIRK